MANWVCIDSSWTPPVDLLHMFTDCTQTTSFCRPHDHQQLPSRSDLHTLIGLSSCQRGADLAHLIYAMQAARLSHTTQGSARLWTESQLRLAGKLMSPDTQSAADQRRLTLR